VAKRLRRWVHQHYALLVQ